MGQKFFYYIFQNGAVSIPKLWIGVCQSQMLAQIIYDHIKSYWNISNEMALKHSHKWKLFDQLRCQRIFLTSFDIFDAILTSLWHLFDNRCQQLCQNLNLWHLSIFWRNETIDLLSPMCWHPEVHQSTPSAYFSQPKFYRFIFILMTSLNDSQF